MKKFVSFLIVSLCLLQPLFPQSIAELEEKKKRSILFMLLDQFKDFMILVLIGAAVIAGVIGELADTLVIIAIVIINAIIGFIQEFRAEKAMEALKRMAAHTATVLREGEITRLAASELVPGDIVMLEAEHSYARSCT